MPSDTRTSRTRPVLRSVVMIGTIAAVGAGLTAWKSAGAREAAAATAAMPEPTEVVTAALAEAAEYRGSATSIGTVLAMRSVTLRNELPGTVRSVRLNAGEEVGAGTVLVALDVSVEEAELKALEARAQLAERTLKRLQRMAEHQAVSAIEVDNARAERDVALAEIERIRAVIEKKTIRAPFRAVVGIADVHPGQFLEAGTLLTTLQGVGEAAHVDFSVSQQVAAELGGGDVVEVFAGEEDAGGIEARVVAVDARIDPTTRNAMVRARIDHAPDAFAPGASVRVRVQLGEPRNVVSIPASALRKGPAGDHVFVLETAESGETRAHVRQVQAGPSLGTSVVILGGLEPGERVAASGSFKLREAALVHVADAPGAGALSAR